MSPLNAVRVLLADDHQVVREGVKGILRGPRFEVVGEAANGVEAVALATRLRPDVALLDHKMPELDGLEVARRLRVAKLATRCVLFTFIAKESLLLQAMRAEMAGFVLKEATAAELRERILLAAAGEPGFEPHHYEALRRKIAEARRTSLTGCEADPPLTSQEENILRLLAQGLSNRDIANLAEVQLATVKTHLNSIYSKVGVTGRMGALLWALERLDD